MTIQIAKVTVERTRDVANENKPIILIKSTWNADADRLDAMGYIFPDTPANMLLALRLKAAILAGKVFVNPEVATDANGNTYIKSGCDVFGRHIKHCLAQIGF